MADGTDEFVRAMTRLLAELIREASRLAIELAERRAERLRLAAQHNERVARAERVRLASHRAADAAIWRRTADPVWWRKATPEQLARAWRAASTWHQSDPEAAGAHRAMAERLRARGIDVDTDLTANPGDARWLQAALDLAMAERDELAALAAEQDSDIAVLADELMWGLDELPRTAVMDPAESRATTASAEVPRSADEVLWALDELTADELARLRAASSPTDPALAAASPTALPQQAAPLNIAEGEVVAADNDPLDAGVPRPDDAASLEPTGGDGIEAESATARPADEKRRPPDATLSYVDRHMLSSPDDALVPPVAADHAQSVAPTAEPEPWPQIAVTDDRNTSAGSPLFTAGNASNVEVATMEHVLRTAYPAAQAARVVQDPSWPALASTMQGLHRAGKDVPNLLRDLPINTTDVKMPAMLTAWMLRAAARGQASLGRAVREREQHLRRAEAARRTAQRNPASRTRDPEDVAVRPAPVPEGSTASLLAAAFPTTTKDALNRRAATAGQPEPRGDHDQTREPVTVER